jgi:hypothetical protein
MQVEKMEREREAGENDYCARSEAGETESD